MFNFTLNKLSVSHGGQSVSHGGQFRLRTALIHPKPRLTAGFMFNFTLNKLSVSHGGQFRLRTTLMHPKPRLTAGLFMYYEFYFQPQQVKTSQRRLKDGKFIFSIRIFAFRVYIIILLYRYSAFGFNGYNTWNSKCVTDDCRYHHKKNKTQEKQYKH